MRLRCLVACAFLVLAAPAAAGDAAGRIIGSVYLADDVTLDSDTIVYVVGYSEPAPDRVAEVRQRDLEFVPPLIAVTAGQEVSFPNDEDEAYHSISSKSPTHRVDLGTYPPGETRTTRLTTPGVVDRLSTTRSRPGAALALQAWRKSDDETGRRSRDDLRVLPGGRSGETHPLRIEAGNQALDLPGSQTAPCDWTLHYLIREPDAENRSSTTYLVKKAAPGKRECLAILVTLRTVTHRFVHESPDQQYWIFPSESRWGGGNAYTFIALGYYLDPAHLPGDHFRIQGADIDLHAVLRTQHYPAAKHSIWDLGQTRPRLGDVIERNGKRWVIRSDPDDRTRVHALSARYDFHETTSLHIQIFDRAGCAAAGSPAVRYDVGGRTRMEISGYCRGPDARPGDPGRLRSFATGSSRVSGDLAYDALEVPSRNAEGDAGDGIQVTIEPKLQVGFGPAELEAAFALDPEAFNAHPDPYVAIGTGRGEIEGGDFGLSFENRATVELDLDHSRRLTVAAVAGAVDLKNSLRVDALPRPNRCGSNPRFRIMLGEDAPRGTTIQTRQSLPAPLPARVIGPQLSGARGERPLEARIFVYETGKSLYLGRPDPEDGHELWRVLKRMAEQRQRDDGTWTDIPEDDAYGLNTRSWEPGTWGEMVLPQDGD